MTGRILGIDEAGRGPWAGPLVVGACLLGDANIEGLTDSKKLSKKKRELIFEQIMQQAAAFGIGWVSSQELDAIGMSEALKLATKRAVESIKVPYEQIIIDGTVNFLCDTPQASLVSTMPKADSKVKSVSAASILAKVSRDRWMAEQALIYPGYCFEKHAGYGTASHAAAIEKFGVTPLHRLSFKPLAKYRSVDYDGWTGAKKNFHGKSLGVRGEEAVVEALKRANFRIITKNWQNKYSEIDVIATKDDNIFFIEVKTRQDGRGLEAINYDKLGRMRRAVNNFLMSQPQYSNLNPKLIAAAVKTNGSAAILTDFVEIID